jgi:hypothetical protein
MNSRTKKLLFPVLLWIWCWASLAYSAESATQAGTNRLDFGLLWPPTSSPDTSAPKAKPLLNGCLAVCSERLADLSFVARLRIVLSRPSDEAGREFWNSRLAFPEYDWMRYVRVWDKENRWLWPNLPYLLRLHGIERVERYGGVDPGKGVDNDFAAVLIRKYDESGTHEDPVTERTPLVAAEWYPVGVSGPVDKHTVVHAAQSDEFTIHLGAPGGDGRGVAVVWLIYADFMGAKLPEAWPKAPEFAGGILAYFELQWDLKAEPGRQLSLRQVVPKRSTGFDWEQWAPRTRAARESKSTAKLSDVAASKLLFPSPVNPGRSISGLSQ